MAGYNWMDDRERQIRERDTRGTGDYRSRYDEDRTWDEGDRSDMYRSGAQGRSFEGQGSQGRGRDRVFGERDSGVSYNREPAAYRGAGQRGQSGQDNESYSRQPARMSREDYRDETLYGGGRFYGDDGRGYIYREEYGQGGVEYGDMPRGYEGYGGYSDYEDRYDAGYSPTRARYHAQGYGQPGYGGYRGERYGGYSGYTDYRGGFDRPASGGTGGYDYERGYGDAGRREMERGGSDHSDFGRRMEQAGRDAGSFLRRAGGRVADWFNAGGEGRVYDDLYARPRTGRGETYRGRGPQGYKRADERISEDTHERLTEDSWVDASNISVSVSGGEVTLSGTVENREAKHRAERLVEDVSGVTHVQNNLRVDKGNYFTSPSPGYGDSVLGAQIREAETDGKATPGTTNGKKT